MTSGVRVRLELFERGVSFFSAAFQFRSEFAANLAAPRLAVLAASASVLVRRCVLVLCIASCARRSSRFSMRSRWKADHPCLPFPLSFPQDWHARETTRSYRARHLPRPMRTQSFLRLIGWRGHILPSPHRSWQKRICAHDSNIGETIVCSAGGAQVKRTDRKNATSLMSNAVGRRISCLRTIHRVPPRPRLPTETRACPSPNSPATKASGRNGT